MMRFRFHGASSRHRKRPPLFLGILFLLIGLVVAGFGVRTIIRAGQSESWPTVEGVVKVSEVDRRHDKDGTTYHADVMYEYTVDGTLYSCDRVSYGDYGSSNSSHARRVCNRYPQGQTVVVYYDPGDPEEAVLEAGRTWATFAVAGFGAIFALVGGGIIHVWRTRAPVKSAPEEMPDPQPAEPSAERMSLSASDDDNPYRTGG
jgi:hypothetical protein